MSSVDSSSSLAHKRPFTSFPSLEPMKVRIPCCGFGLLSLAGNGSTITLYLRITMPSPDLFCTATAPYFLRTFNGSRPPVTRPGSGTARFELSSMACPQGDISQHIAPAIPSIIELRPPHTLKDVMFLRSPDRHPSSLRPTNSQPRKHKLSDEHVYLITKFVSVNEQKQRE